MKRKLLCLLLILSLLTACAAPVTFGGRRPLADDGIVSVETVAALREQNGVAVMTGNSNGVSFEWTLFGADIPNDASLSLGVTVEGVGESSLTVRFSDTSPLPFSPLLSLTLPVRWNVQSASVGIARANGIAALSTASVTQSGQGSTVHLSVTDRDGALRVVPQMGFTAAPNITRPTALPTASAETVTPDAYQNPPSGSDIQLATVPSQGTDAVADPTETGMLTCMLSIECASIFSHLADLNEAKLAVLPENGVILSRLECRFQQGESVWSVLQRVCREQGIPLEASFTPVYGSTYVEGIGNLYEFDCGELSGWMYEVNGWFPNYGCSLYELKDGDEIQFRYTCELGSDIGGASALN